MNNEQEWEWRAIIFDVKGDGLSMELLKFSRPTVTIVVDEDILLGLIAISRQHEGKETDEAHRHMSSIADAANRFMIRATNNMAMI